MFQYKTGSSNACTRFLNNIIFILLANTVMNAQPITPVTGFGTNPGALNMYTYVPSGISGPAPLVIAMHGCTQTAAQFSTQSGWNKLANLHKFYVVYPEQISANNSSLCFNWFDTTDVNKNVGEALSVKQMVDYMKANYSINPSAIYVTGISAGAGMTAAMLATYPDVFSSGAIMSGLPYKAATDVFTASTAMNGGVTKTPAQWGDLVRAQNPGYTGTLPHVAIFHGTNDFTVNFANANELIKQWTNVNHADQTVDSVNNAFQGNTSVQQNIYTDSTGKTVVCFYKITGMGHAIAVDTGSCPRQGGATATYAVKETNFHSTYWAADFFNLISGPYSITGPASVSAFAGGKVYSVPATSGSSYLWTVPAGATISSGQGTNSITVTFSNKSGDVEVTETVSGGCRLDAAKLYVTVSISAGIPEQGINSCKLYYDPADRSITLLNTDLHGIQDLTLCNILGQNFNGQYTVQDSKILLSSRFAPGIYILRFTNNGQSFFAKFAVN